MNLFGCCVLLLQTVYAHDAFERLNQRFPDKFMPSLINTFRLAKKWEQVDIQIPTMKHRFTKIGIMVPGITREFGTYSIFRRVGITIEFLLEKQVAEAGGVVSTHEFINLNSARFLENREMFLAYADRCVYSPVDDLRFVRMSVTPTYYQSEILSQMENYGHFRETFGPPAPPQFLSRMDKFVHAKMEEKKQMERLLPRSHCETQICMDAFEIPIKKHVVYSECTCTATNFMTLTGTKCVLDKDGNPTITCVHCKPENALLACGTWSTIYAECDCPSNTESEQKCFKFHEDFRNAPLQCMTTGKTRECIADNCNRVFNDCKCLSEDPWNPSAIKCDQHEYCTPCDDTVACGTLETTVSECSVTCDKGVQDTVDTFTWFNGQVVTRTTTNTCKMGKCPAWAKWEQFTLCSGNCKPVGGDAPTKTRSRCWDDGNGPNCAACARDGDEPCQETETKECNKRECKAPCTWTLWGEYGECTPQCAAGIKIRKRVGTKACTEAATDGTLCADDFPEECPTCHDTYGRCDTLTAYCNHFKYVDQLRKYCTETCGYCAVRRKRSINRFNRYFKDHDDLDLLVRLTEQ